MTFPCTDTGNAERLVAVHGKDVRYCAAWKSWLVYDGKRWERDVRGRVHHFAKLTARRIYGEAEQCDDGAIRQAIANWAKRSESREKRAAMVACAQSEPTIAVHHRDFDRDPWLFNVANGTLALRKGTLVEHRRGDLITKLSPVAFDANASAPLWEKFLTEVLPDVEVRTFVQRFAGCCLSGDVTDRMFVFLSGGGRNGKSVLMKVLRTLLGDYAIVGAPDLLMAKKEQSHPTEIADLFGARLVSCQEVPKGRTLNEQRVKELTGDEGSIKARRMNEDFWEFTPTFKIAIAGNHPPRVADDTDSIWDRMRKVPFTVRIADGAVDKNLFAKLHAELPGILNWAVRGCIDWLKHGLPAPKAVAEATLEYRSEEDTLGRFLSDCCLIHPDARATVKGISDACAEWCRTNGEREVTRKVLAERLSREGCFPERTNKARGWRGVRLLQAAEMTDDSKGGDEVTRGDAQSSTDTREEIQLKIDPLSASPIVTRHYPPVTSPLSPALNGIAPDDGEPYYDDLDDHGGVQ